MELNVPQSSFLWQRNWQLWRASFRCSALRFETTRHNFDFCFCGPFCNQINGGRNSGGIRWLFRQRYYSNQARIRQEVNSATPANSHRQRKTPRNMLMPCFLHPRRIISIGLDDINIWILCLGSPMETWSFMPPSQIIRHSSASTNTFCSIQFHNIHKVCKIHTNFYLLNLSHQYVGFLYDSHHFLKAIYYIYF